MTDKHERDPAEILVEGEGLPGAADILPVNDDEGNIRQAFVAAVEAAIESGDEPRLLALAGPLHEADLASLIEALPADLRSRLVELMGADFDFAALTELDANIRDEILQELPTRTVAEGMRDLEADDALVLLEDFDQAEQAEILDALPADRPCRAASARSNMPESSAGPAHADDARHRAAVLDGGADDRFSARCRCRRLCRSPSSRSSSSIRRIGCSAMSFSTGCCARRGTERLGES